MKALIIAAHGSRKTTANEETLALVKKFDRETQHSFDFVVCAFLQFAEPGLIRQIDRLVDQGVEQIVVFPFFIGAGSHITTDIPALVEQTRKIHPSVKIAVATHLGRLDDIEDIIFKEVEKYFKE